MHSAAPLLPPHDQTPPGKSACRAPPCRRARALSTTPTSAVRSATTAATAKPASERTAYTPPRCPRSRLSAKAARHVHTQTWWMGHGGRALPAHRARDRAQLEPVVLRVLVAPRHASAWAPTARDGGAVSQPTVASVNPTSALAASTPITSRTSPPPASACPVFFQASWVGTEPHVKRAVPANSPMRTGQAVPIVRVEPTAPSGRSAQTVYHQTLS